MYMIVRSLSSCSSWNTPGMAVAQASLPSLAFQPLPPLCVQATGRQSSRRSAVFYPNPSSSQLSGKGRAILTNNRPWRFSRISAMAQGSRVTKVTSKELDAILDGTRDCPVVVDFYATWCGPCILLSEELDQLATEYGEAVKFLKVDTDEEHELASEMKIQGLPTLIFVSKDTNKNAIRTEGLLPADVIRNIIENEL